MAIAQLDERRRSSGAVASVVAHRATRRGRVLAVTALLLGVGFGVSLSSFAIARRTASAYDRVLEAADAEDATISHQRSPQELAAVLDGIDAVVRHSHQAGFIGSIEGVDPSLTGALLAASGDRFAVELPELRDGRLPQPDRADEIFVNDFLADAVALSVGQQINLSIVRPSGDGVETVRATVVGIGLLPREVVIDETKLTGIIVFTRAFLEAHADLSVYSTSRIFLAPGADAARDVAPVLGALGYELSEIRDRDRDSVADAMRPALSILIAVGVLALVATLVAAGQLAQRDHEHWHDDDETLAVLGMVPSQLQRVRLVLAGGLGVVVAAIAIVIVVATSALAPFGPLHDVDPAQGFHLDMTVSGIGLVAIVFTVAAVALAFGRTVTSRDRWSPASGPRVATPTRPAAAAGLNLAFGGTGGRGSALRASVFAALAAAALAAVATVVVSSAELSDSPARYGADWDLAAVNAFGAQSIDALDDAFGGDDVLAATAYSSFTFLVNNRAVAGLAATPIKGQVPPTILRGRPLSADDEIVVGTDTLDALRLDVGDAVSVQTAGTLAGGPAPAPVELRIVGAATFAAIGQQGIDQARLGKGVLVTRPAFDRMVDSPSADPEFTLVRLRDGVDPETIIARNPLGIRDRGRIATRWFTNAKPAELRQVDAVRGLLVAGAALGLVVAVSVFVHLHWSRARLIRRDIAVLGVMGLTRRQRSEVVAWQAVPSLLVALVVGLPVGIAIGRWGFSAFVRSLAMVDRAVTPIAMVAALAVAIAVAAVVGAVVAIAVSRRDRIANTLRDLTTARADRLVS